MGKHVIVFFFATYAAMLSCVWSVKAWILQMNGNDLVGVYITYTVMAFGVFIIFLEFFNKVVQRLLIAIAIIYEFSTAALMDAGYGTSFDLYDLALAALGTALVVTVLYRYFTRNEK